MTAGAGNGNELELELERVLRAAVDKWHRGGLDVRVAVLCAHVNGQDIYSWLLETGLPRDEATKMLGRVILLVQRPNLREK
jgi:hypothetical protein